MQANQYFALIVPACGVLLGLALIACWAALRKQRYLLWIAAGYVLPAIPLAAQNLMSNSQLAGTSTVMGVFYLAGLWSLAQGMAKKYNGTAHPFVALLISVVTLGVLYYFSVVTDQLPLRMLALNVAMALLVLLGVVAVYRSKKSPDRFERVLRWSYLVFVLYSLIRLGVVFYIVSSGSMPELSLSPEWLLMLAANLLLSLWFIGIVLVVAVREVIAKLQSERDYDPLTQLLNRRAFGEHAAELLHQSDGRSLALVMCDVDHFKQINDTLGHAAGDEALKTVAKVLASNVRQGDLVARFGGEEFVLMLRCAGMDEAKAVANRIREQLAASTFPSMNRKLTASFGLVVLDSGLDLPAAFKMADSSLYYAKSTGRNKVISNLDMSPVDMAA